MSFTGFGVVKTLELKINLNKISIAMRGNLGKKKYGEKTTKF